MASSLEISFSFSPQCVPVNAHCSLAYYKHCGIEPVVSEVNECNSFHFFLQFLLHQHHHHHHPEWNGLRIPKSAHGLFYCYCSNYEQQNRKYKIRVSNQMHERKWIHYLFRRWYVVCSFFVGFNELVSILLFLINFLNTKISIHAHE